MNFIIDEYDVAFVEQLLMDCGIEFEERSLSDSIEIEENEEEAIYA